MRSQGKSDQCVAPGRFFSCVMIVLGAWFHKTAPRKHSVSLMVFWIFIAEVLTIRSNNASEGSFATLICPQIVHRRKKNIGRLGNLRNEKLKKKRLEGRSRMGFPCVKVIHGHRGIRVAVASLLPSCHGRFITCRKIMVANDIQKMRGQDKKWSGCA